MDERKMNNRGQIAIFLLVGLVIVFLGMILFIVLGFFSTNLYDALDIDVDLGQVNLQEYNDLTIGKFNDMVVNNADWWGLALIFGMVLGLAGGAYFTRGKFPKLGILIDIGVILGAFFVSLYLSAVYSDLVIALSSAGQDFAVDHLTRSNFFILNLPLFVTIIGVLMMILFHTGIPPKQEEINTFPEVVTG